MTHSRGKIGFMIAVLFSAMLVGGARAAETVEQFGADLAQALQTGDPDRITSAMDKDELIGRALAGTQGSEAFVSGMRQGLERGLSRVGVIMTNNLGPTVRSKFLRARTVDGVTRVLLRLDLGDRGLNYLDFFVHQRSDGSWAVFDWIDFVQGQTFSESPKMVIAMMVREDPGMLGRLLGLTEIDTELADQIAELGTLGQKGDWTGWLRVYHTLPEQVRASRVLLTTRVAAASTIGNSVDYMDAMADLHKHHGDDPTLNLALLDYYLLTAEYARAYAAVDRLDEYTGGDAALTSLRAGIALIEGRNAESIRYARQAIDDDADFEDPYWHLMVAGARASDYAAAMQGVRGLETRFGYEFSEDELKKSEDFPGLLASDAWRSDK